MDLKLYSLLLFVIVSIFLILMFRKKLTKPTMSLLLTLLSILSYLTYTVYLGLFLGGRPDGWYEGWVLVLPFYPLAIIALVVALLALITSVLAIRQANSQGEVINWHHLVSFGAASMATALFALFIFFPIGLGVAYEIAEIRRATWEVR